MARGPSDRERRLGGAVSAPAGGPAISAREVRTYLLRHSALIAPADVRWLVTQGDEVRAKATADTDRHKLFHQQIDLALNLLSDHVNGECPQIPYSAVALLAAALFYWLEPIDIIPDFIPGKGTADDALVLAVAYQLGKAGIQRYCTFRGIPSSSLFVGVPSSRR